MEKINKNSLIIFGYSEVLTLGLVVNSKLHKVKEFNIFKDDNHDKFFKVISSFISNKVCFNHVLYSCGPGGFTIIRRILSYVKALNFYNGSNTKFIGLNNLFITACHFNYKYKLIDKEYILSILNHSKDNFIQIFQNKNKSHFFIDSISDVKNIDLDTIENYLNTLNLSTQNIQSVYLGPNSKSVSIFDNIELVNRSDILDTIIKLSDLIENHKISQTDYRQFFEEKFNPLYGKLPAIN